MLAMVVMVMMAGAAGTASTTQGATDGTCGPCRCAGTCRQFDAGLDALEKKNNTGVIRGAEVSRHETGHTLHPLLKPTPVHKQMLNKTERAGVPALFYPHSDWPTREHLRSLPITIKYTETEDKTREDLLNSTNSAIVKTLVFLSNNLATFCQNKLFLNDFLNVVLSMIPVIICF